MSLRNSKPLSQFRETVGAGENLESQAVTRVEAAALDRSQSYGALRGLF